MSEPAKFDDITAAISNVAATSTGGTTVDGKRYDAGFIISGWGKAGKIAYNARPYGYYFQAVAKFLSCASRLLILGYGWRDEHLNTWLGEMIDLQPTRRCAIITHRVGSDYGENTPLERSFNAIAGGTVWKSLDSSAYYNPEDQSWPRFFEKKRFAIAPGGFVLDDDTEAALLRFLMQP